LKNININEVLCNGTRLVIKRLYENLICAVIKSGTWMGIEVFISRMQNTSSKDLPFTLIRKQFPVRLAFTMTINKSQGRTMDKIGIYLPDPVFSHGQLYLAFSRVRSASSIKILIKNSIKQGYNSDDGKTYTVNVVYKYIFE
jgi:ATP-dependent DNA helicase PIF1